MRGSRAWLWAGLAALMVTASACATGQAVKTAELSQETPALAGTFFDGRTGEVLGDVEVLNRLAAARVVFVGEQHAEPTHHRLQAMVTLALARKLGGSVVAAIEWLPVSARVAIARWSQGFEPVATLGEAVSWDDTWGHALNAYTPFFEMLRAAQVAIEPINAEPGLARAVARETPLDAVQTALLPPLTSGTPEHRAWFEQQMSDMGDGHHGHTLSPESLDRLYRAQLVWDETMAANVLKLLKEDALVVVCAGTGHVTHALGIPARIGALPKVIVMPLESASEVPTRASERGFPLREADLFWVP